MPTWTHSYIKKPEKVAIARHCNLKAARRRTGRFGLSLAILYCACVQTAVGENMREKYTQFLAANSTTLFTVQAVINETRLMTR